MSTHQGNVVTMFRQLGQQQSMHWYLRDVHMKQALRHDNVYRCRWW